MPEMLRKDENNQRNKCNRGPRSHRKDPEAPGFMGNKTPFSNRIDLSACLHAQASWTAKTDDVRKLLSKVLADHFGELKNAKIMALFDQKNECPAVT